MLLTGDLARLRENYDNLGVQPINSVAARRWPHRIASGSRRQPERDEAFGAPTYWDRVVARALEPAPAPKARHAVERSRR